MCTHPTHSWSWITCATNACKVHANTKKHIRSLPPLPLFLRVIFSLYTPNHTCPCQKQQGAQEKGPCLLFIWAPKSPKMPWQTSAGWESELRVARGSVLYKGPTMGTFGALPHLYILYDGHTEGGRWELVSWVSGGTISPAPEGSKAQVFPWRVT